MQALAELIGTSPGITALREQVRRLLARQGETRRLPPVLIQGETGTGKGLLARILHRAGPRPGGPFVDVNCAAIPETLLEAELFGFERGAFTDARHAKVGLFQTANRGTLFLDEVALLPEALQAKLLKAIEERAVRRLGSTRTEAVDVWILTATNEDLTAAVQARRFREDLYHRLAVLTMQLPPLRERQEDIPPLAEHFLTRACGEYDLPAKTFAPEARAALVAHRWPGNVRELANVMERVALLSEAALVTVEMLGLPESSPGGPTGEPARRDRGAALEEALGVVERQHLAQALEETRWNVTRAAARLAISRDTLRYRIAKHDLRPSAPRRPRRAARPAPAAGAAAPAPVEGAGAATVRWDRRRLAFLRVALTVPTADDPRLYPSRAIEVLIEKVQSFGGRVEELAPSGIVAVFGLEPVEDAPRRAVHAALAIHNAAERAWHGESEPLAVASGVHVASVLVGQSAVGAQLDLEGKRRAGSVLEAVVGPVAPDGIAVSDAAAPFLERHFSLTPLAGSGPGPERVYRLRRGGPTGLASGRRLATFAGRRQELDLLRSRWEAAKRGHGQVVGVLGEAGMGKSRLLHELRQSLRGERVTYLEAACPSYGGATPYLPVLDILRQNLRIRSADGPEGIAEKVRAGLRGLGMDAGEWAPYLLQLLGVREGTESLATLATGAIKARTFETLRQMGVLGSRQRPIVFVVEDLHWIDPTSEECFTSLMESLAGAPALFLTTYRPGYRPPWMDKSYVTQVALQPLSEPDSLTVVRSVLQTDDVPEPVARLVLAKSEGNPFFLEEFSRAAWSPGADASPVAVPDTIHEVLLARMARLAEEPRRLLQTTSVLGREAPVTLLRALRGDAAGDLEPELRELVRLEFLYEQSGGIAPVYAFTHTLTQEVAYESLPASRRVALHAAAGQALEQLYADRLEEVYDRLVHHYAKSEHADRAVLYLTRSAERAARGHAHAEAVSTLEEALRHVERLPAADRGRHVLDLVLHQAASLVPLGDFQAIVDLFGRHQASLERLDDPRVAGQYYFLLGRSQLFLGDDEAAAESARRGIEAATRSDDQATLGRLDYLLAQQAALSGRMPDGIEHARRAIRRLEQTGQQWWLGPACWALGLNHALMGEFEPALEALERATALGQEVGDLELESVAGWPIGVIRTAQGEFDLGLEACRQALRVAPNPLNSATALGWLGHVHLESGDAEEAVTLLGHAVEQVGRFGFVQLEGWFTALLADAHRAAGRLGRAEELARHALALTRRTRSLYGVGLAERALGQVARARGDLAAARPGFAAALETFGRIHARYEEGRTHLDLALAHGDDPASGAAARHLAAAYELFRLLRIPVYVARTRELAKELDVPLPDGPAR